MKSKEIRAAFLDFFEEKGHKIVPSAPMVIKNDPTLMFTNAGMNQFKDYFLGNQKPENRRIADTQKCLRVTGKHNDLEEVGHDTYHHTMFEMLGNWSFGDYFKEEAISWAWEFLTVTVGLKPEVIYATVFEGDSDDRIERDHEAAEIWAKFLPPERILNGNKKDNFWEMGVTGPCGPCSEIHLDLRDPEERLKTPGADLVNKDHPLVLEIWNLVFIQYNRLTDQSLMQLPDSHVDTGMGFERLCMALQGKKSNYDTDLFSPVIQKIAEHAGVQYGVNPSNDIAMRVIADHLRAIAFSVAEGQLPSNNKAGYVIRRILRRAIRYGFTYLEQNEPFIYKLMPVLSDVMGENFQELKSQQGLIEKVIFEEEQSFLNTLENGIRRLNEMMDVLKREDKNTLDGKQAFELYDTYGFPLDLTELILKENNMHVNAAGFTKEMEIQKQRSKNAAAQEKGDWILVGDEESQEFTGFETTNDHVRILKYREVQSKDKKMYHIVLNRTPFYAESGGQIGDRGVLSNDREQVYIVDTQKENDLIIQYTKELPKNPEAGFIARVNESERTQTASNHTATHLTHYALRKILGSHVEQKGSLVNSKMFRFDFSHFQKVTDEELREVEKLVNRLIRQNIHLEEHRAVPMEEAKNMGAMSLFGEKYGDRVRVIRFGDSVELCGGIHAVATGQLGFFKITKETSIAAGIRRIEALTGVEAEKYIYGEIDKLSEIAAQFEKQPDVVGAVRKLLKENADLNKQADSNKKEALNESINKLKEKSERVGEINFISEILPMADANMLRDAAFRLKSEIDNLFLVLGSEQNGKALLVVMISDNLVQEHALNASEIIRSISKEIKGGGGGQPFFATAGGKNPAGIPVAFKKAKSMLPA